MTTTTTPRLSSGAIAQLEEEIRALRARYADLTRLAGVDMPREHKPLIDYTRYAVMNPAEVRAYTGDGSFGGDYQRDEADVQAMWQVAVDETRALLEGPWS